MQAVSKQAKQKGLQQSVPAAGLLPSPSKGKTSLPRGSPLPGPQSEPPQRQHSRLTQSSHADTDKQPNRQGYVEQGEQAGASAAAAKAMSEQNQHRRSKRVATKPTGMWQASDQAETEPSPQKSTLKEAIQTPLAAAKGKGKGKKGTAASAEQKAASVQQKTAGTKPEPVHVPSGFQASSKKAASSKGKVKGSKAQAAPNSEVKPPAGIDDQDTAVAQSPALKAKPERHAKTEPAAATPQFGSSLQAGMLVGNADSTPLGLSMGKRKRTATKFLHMEDDSSVQGQAGSKATGSEKKPQDVR